MNVHEPLRFATVCSAVFLITAQIMRAKTFVLAATSVHIPLCVSSAARVHVRVCMQRKLHAEIRETKKENAIHYNFIILV